MNDINHSDYPVTIIRNNWYRWTRRLTWWMWSWSRSWAREKCHYLFQMLPQNTMQQPKKYNNIGQPRQQNMKQGNSYYIQESYKMTRTMTSQPVGFLANYMWCMTKPIWRLDTEGISQWNGYYLIISPPSMCS